MNGVFEMIVVACSIIGLLSASHLAILFVSSRLMSALDMTKIGTIGFCVVGIVFFCWPPQSLFQFWIRSQAPAALGLLSAVLLAKRRENAVVESLDEVITLIIMRMKEGRSMAVAFELVATEIRSSLRPRWIEISRAVSFSPQKNSSSVRLNSLRLTQIAREFRRIDDLSRAQIVELERWRSRLRSERIFRRRSVQAMAQVRAQSVILGLIYVLLLLFSTSAFGIEAALGPLKVSGPIFAVGLFLIWRGGRRVKWSV